MSFLAPLAEMALPAIVGGIAGGAQNAAMTGLNTQDELFQLGLYGEQMRHQETMQIQSTAFDEAMDERSENMREVNVLRDITMAQRKADDGIVRKFIQMIGQ
ncbi:MAG: hypothetical protein ACYDHD_01975 [Vulcanimicrobiaceae bacterium]